MTSRGILGFVAQGMDGRKKTFHPYTASYGGGARTWTCPSTGWYRFALWGSGGQNGGVSGAGGGALAIKIKRCARGDQIALVVAGNPATAATTATFPDGSVVSAGSGASGGTAGGTATGGDVNLPGVAGGASNGGAAPSYQDLTGGVGYDAVSPLGNSFPGGGGNISNSVQLGGGVALITRQPTSLL